jgi:hypothetical protein
MKRRDFLKYSSAATLGALASGAPVIGRADDAEPVPAATADTLIVLWMGGGMAHTETFDPKRYRAFEPGLASSEILSTFKAVPTVVDGLSFSEGLEHIGRVMDRGTLIRTYTAGDLGAILHSRHQYQWHTGYAPPQTVAAPHLGAVIARTLGPKHPDVPAFVDIGQKLTVGEGEELKAFHTAGFLGTEFGPFFVPDPSAAQATVRPPAGMTGARYARRREFYKKLVEASPIAQMGAEYHRDSLVRSLDGADRLLSSPAAKAFDLADERPEVLEAYGTSRFGQGCLLARRLCEYGARFIEVTTEYVPFEHWDTHENGHTRMIELKKRIDRPVAQLVLDLEERGLLERTLIVLASEFSRDMLTEGKPGNKVKDQVEVPDVMTELKHYGMHRHFTDAGCVLMMGGGARKGYVHGKTADERPCKTIENPVYIEDLHATIYRAMGISPKQSFIIEKRPFYATRDGLGKPIREIIA